MLRRTALLTIPAGLLALAGCSTTSGTSPMTVAQIKPWVDAVVGAAMAAAQTYLASSPPPTPANAAIVQGLITNLTTAKTAFDGLTDTATAQTTALQIVGLVQNLLPIVSGYFPPGIAADISLGLSIVQAFIAALPPPASAPATPPATLQRAAMAYHG